MKKKKKNSKFKCFAFSCYHHLAELVYENMQAILFCLIYVFHSIDGIHRLDKSIACVFLKPVQQDGDSTKKQNI